MSGQFKIYLDSSKYGRLQEVISDYALSWCVAEDIYAFFVRKIFGCHPEDVRFFGLC